MRLHVKNFRSIREMDELEVAPLTLLYGPNGAGKSSLVYSLLTLRNFILNSNQLPNGLFNYTFANLGNYEAVVFDHNLANSIELGVTVEHNEFEVRYTLTFNETGGRLELSLNPAKGSPNPVKVLNPSYSLHLDFTFPYPLNQSTRVSGFSPGLPLHEVIWNGIIAQVKTGLPDSFGEATRLAESLNAPAELLSKVQIVPLKRGFSKPLYSSVSLSPLLITEDEVATYLSSNKYLESKLSRYLERIVERDFRVNRQPGTSLFSLDSNERKTGIASELVNEGFGVNQIVHFLAVCLHSGRNGYAADAPAQREDVICVEEPEIHLHPSAVRRLAQALVEISREERKRFLISTHSEAFLSALLTIVAQGDLDPSDLACYYAVKEGKSTRFERQQVNEKGQIEGGLVSFLEGEMADIRTLLKVAE